MDIEALKARVEGTVITANNPGHERATQGIIWNGRKPALSPRVIVRAASASDVGEATRFAMQTGLTVSARGAGHNFSGIAARGDIVVDLSRLDGLHLDPAARTARVEPGVTNARMAAALERHGLAFPLGHCGSVPMSGYLLGGGLGWNGANWGIACFLVEAVEVVLPDGRAILASETRYPEVFWAARGGGPAFIGIVTAYHVRLKKRPKAISLQIRVYPGLIAVEVADWAEAAMSAAPACVECALKVSPGTDGPLVTAILTVFAESEAEGAEIHRALVRGAPEPLEAMGPLPTDFAGLYAGADPSMPEGRRYGVDSFWSNTATRDLVLPVVDAMQGAPAAESYALIVPRQHARPIPEGAAFSCHGRNLGIVYGIWEKPENDGESMAWLRRTIDAVAPFSTGAYVGECDLERPNRSLPVHTTHAAERLRVLRATYDPQGVLAAYATHTDIAAE